MDLQLDEIVSSTTDTDQRSHGNSNIALLQSYATTNNPIVTSSIFLVANDVPVVLPWILAPTHALTNEMVTSQTAVSSTSHLFYSGLSNHDQTLVMSRHFYHDASSVQVFLDERQQVTLVMVVDRHQSLMQPRSVYESNCDPSERLCDPVEPVWRFRSDALPDVLHSADDDDDDDDDRTVCGDEDVAGYSDVKDDVTVMKGCGRRRKQPKPRRSAPLDDPGFRGVVVKMRTKFDGKKCRLEMSCEYRFPRPTAAHRHIPRDTCKDNANSSSPSRAGHVLSDSQSDSEFGMLTNNDTLRHSSHCVSDGFLPGQGHMTSADKECRSCNVRKTPLWRDAEDGTPLCNACGIRYKKYRVWCGSCWNIPKKESPITSKSTDRCLKCGDPLRVPASVSHRINSKGW